MITMGAYEGDLVRPLGFVTLYFAYAEACLEEVLVTLVGASDPGDPRVHSFGTKVGAAVQFVERIGVHKLPGLAAILQEARPIVEARNDLVHGQLFNGGRLVTKSGARAVTAQEIEALAERIFSWKERLWERHCRELMPLAASLKATAAVAAAQQAVHGLLPQAAGEVNR